MRKILVLCALLSVATGCSVISGSRSDQRLAELRKMKQLWHTNKFVNYEMIYEVDCFCPPEALRPFRVQVKNGKVVKAISVDGTVEIPENFLLNWKTIPALFDHIMRAILEPAHKFTVTYHPVYGYPTYFDVHWDKNIPDSYGTYKVSTVVPIL
jgi:hypothetical protein